MMSSLVPFPFSLNQAASKKRPAVVVVLLGAYNAARPDVIVMAITRCFGPVRPLARSGYGAWQEAGLIKLLSS